MSPSDRHVIAVIVEAADPAVAKMNAMRLMASWPVDYPNTTPFRPVGYMIPPAINTVEASTILDGFWRVMRDRYVECLKDILGSVALAEGDSDALLEDQDFRRACAVVGSLDGAHILIWGPVMDPLITLSNIEELRRGLPQEGDRRIYNPDRLWVVVMEIED